MSLIFRGADLVLAGGVVPGRSLVIEHGRVTAIDEADRPAAPGDDVRDVTGRIVAPGFIDVHVHGLLGQDVLDGPGAVERVAALLPRYGVTAFCPTSLACSAGALDRFLAEVGRLMAPASDATLPARARVLGAHLESNFLNAGYRGAQPLEWLRLPAEADDILAVVRRLSGAIAVVTLAPELSGADALIAELVGLGVTVSLGHSGATWAEAEAAFAQGARRATHLFNRMAPLSAREPGLTGAALSRPDVVVELIADGHHVHPSLLGLVWTAKGAGGVAAITDGTAGSGLPRGARTALGGRPVTVEEVARLDDGTMAGSVATMASVLDQWVRVVGVPLAEAVTMCARTPALSVGRSDLGRLEPGAPADVVVLTSDLTVAETWIGGRQVFHT